MKTIYMVIASVLMLTGVVMAMEPVQLSSVYTNDDSGYNSLVNAIFDSQAMSWWNETNVTSVWNGKPVHVIDGTPIVYNNNLNWQQGQIDVKNTEFLNRP